MKFFAYAAICSVASLSSLVSAGYYDDIKKEAKDDAMLSQLNKLVNTGNRSLTYDNVWKAFIKTGTFLPNSKNCDRGKIADIYSNHCWKPGPNPRN